MKLIDRYIINNFLWSFVGILFICIVLFLVYMLIDVYEDILDNSPTPYYVILYFVNSLPYLLFEVIPLAVAIATLLMVGTMARNREILGLLTSGVSQKQIAQPLIYLGVVLAVGVFLLSELVIPKCQSRARFIEKAYIEGKGEEIITSSDDLFVTGKDNRYYILDNYDSLLKKMTNPIIIDTVENGGKLQNKMKAASSEFVERKEGESYWRFYNLQVWAFNEDGSIKEYKQYTEPVVFAMENQLDKFLSYRKEPEEMNLWELQSYLSILRNRGENVGRYATDLHLKISFPLAVILVIIVCFSFASRMQLGNLVITFAEAMALIIGFYAITALFRAMGHNLVLPPLIAAWTPDALFAVIGITIFKYYSI